MKKENNIQEIKQSFMKCVPKYLQRNFCIEKNGIAPINGKYSRAEVIDKIKTDFQTKIHIKNTRCKSQLESPNKLFNSFADQRAGLSFQLNDSLSKSVLSAQHKNENCKENLPCIFKNFEGEKQTNNSRNESLGGKISANSERDHSYIKDSTNSISIQPQQRSLIADFKTVEQRYRILCNKKRRLPLLKRIKQQ